MYIQNIQVVHEATIVNDMARRIPKINVALEDRKLKHQSTMIKIKGKILD